MTEDELAEACAKAFWEGDRFSRGLGFERLGCGAGWAEVRGLFDGDYLNPHDTAHGAMMFALGAAAFGVAAHTRNQRAVAQEISVVYADRAFAGEVLTARAEETSRAGKTAVIDVSLTRADGRKVALLRGIARSVAGKLVEDV